MTNTDQKHIVRFGDGSEFDAATLGKLSARFVERLGMALSMATEDMDDGQSAGILAGAATVRAVLATGGMAPLVYAMIDQEGNVGLHVPNDGSQYEFDLGPVGRALLADRLQRYVDKAGVRYIVRVGLRPGVISYPDDGSRVAVRRAEPNKEEDLLLTVTTTSVADRSSIRWIGKLRARPDKEGLEVVPGTVEHGQPWDWDAHIRAMDQDESLVPLPPGLELLPIDTTTNRELGAEPKPLLVLAEVEAMLAGKSDVELAFEAGRDGYNPIKALAQIKELRERVAAQKAALA